MILMPIFMPQPKVGFYIRSLEENMEVTARREAVLQVLNENDNLTLQDIAIKTNQDIRTTQAILTVLQKYGKIKSIYTEQGKLWRVIDDVRPAPEYVTCKECTMWEDCENKESRDGCYFGEKEADGNETLD